MGKEIVFVEMEQGSNLEQQKSRVPTLCRPCLLIIKTSHLFRSTLYKVALEPNDLLQKRQRVSNEVTNHQARCLCFNGTEFFWLPVIERTLVIRLDSQHFPVNLLLIFPYSLTLKILRLQRRSRVVVSLVTMAV